MKMIQRWVLLGVVVLGTAFPAMASASFNESSNNWDAMAWDRGGYYGDYYPHVKTCGVKKHRHHCY